MKKLRSVRTYHYRFHVAYTCSSAPTGQVRPENNGRKRAMSAGTRGGGGGGRSSSTLPLGKPIRLMGFHRALSIDNRARVYVHPRCRPPPSALRLGAPCAGHALHSSRVREFAYTALFIDAIYLPGLRGSDATVREREKCMRSLRVWLTCRERYKPEACAPLSVARAR